MRNEMVFIAIPVLDGSLSYNRIPNPTERFSTQQSLIVIMSYCHYDHYPVIKKKEGKK